MSEDDPAGLLRVAQSQRDDAERQMAVLVGQVTEARTLLTSAKNALRSYQFGNGSPDLAKEIADAIEKVWRY